MIVTVTNLSPRKSIVSRLGWDDVFGCWLVGTLLGIFGLMFARIDVSFAQHLWKVMLGSAGAFWFAAAVLAVVIVLRDKSSH